MSDKKILIAVKIPLELNSKIQEIAKKEGLNKSIIVRQALTKNIQKRYNKKYN